MAFSDISVKLQSLQLFSIQKVVYKSKLNPLHFVQGKLLYKDANKLTESLKVKFSITI